MAAFDHVKNMYDPSLKPRLLRRLLKDYIPQEKEPFRNPLDLSYVVSTIKTHRLLAESLYGGTNSKQFENWQSAIDSWVNRLLTLISSSIPDKCWAGVSLLGVTCQECGSERFLASYSVWLNKLLSNIQPPAESHFVKVVSCASVSDLITRLGGYPHAKKDGTSHAAKVIQPVLKLLNEDGSEAVWEGAVCLLCSIIIFFPSSVQRHYDSIEAAIASKIMSGKCSAKTLKICAQCLALLPQSGGDDETWLLMMQKILYSINIYLNEVFQGLEEESKSNEVMRVLVPPGKDPPPPLGGQIMLETSNLATKGPERLLTSTVSTLMNCCCMLLTSCHASQVILVAHPLIVLLRRVLMVDGSLPQALYAFTTVMQQESLCSELPILHLHSLEIIIALTKGFHSQLMPYVGDIVRLITEYFRRCALPELRAKVYSIIRILLMSMGVGLAVSLAQQVVDNAFLDLDSYGQSSHDTSITKSSKVSSEAQQQPGLRKRKHSNASGFLEQQPVKGGLEGGVPKKLTPVILNIAALEALEALFTVGGASRSAPWRSKIDHLLITIASGTKACKYAWAEEDGDMLHGEHAPTWEDLQLASLRALLASLLSPGHVQPNYLPQGLELFHRGLQKTGTKLAEFCAHAILALEVLIHPRALSLIDFAFASNSHAVNKFPSSSGKQSASLSVGALSKGTAEIESDEDDLYKSWLRDSDEFEDPVTDKLYVANMEQLSLTVGHTMEENLHSVDLSRENVGEETATAVAAAAAEGNDESITKERATESAEAVGNGNEIFVVAHRSEEAISRDSVLVANVDSSAGKQPIDLVSDKDAVVPMDTEMASKKDSAVMAEGFGSTGEEAAKESKTDDSASKGDEITMTGEKTYAKIFNPDSNKEYVFVLDSDSPSMDSFPDIVDGDPDSD